MEIAIRHKTKRNSFINNGLCNTVQKLTCTSIMVVGQDAYAHALNAPNISSMISTIVRSLTVAAGIALKDFDDGKVISLQKNIDGFNRSAQHLNL